MTPPGGAPTPGEAPDLAAQSEGKGEGNNPLPLQLELPSAKGPSEPAAGVAAHRAGPPRPFQVGRLALVALGALVLFAAIAAATAVWALPSYVRRQCIEIAASRAVDLEVDGANIDWGGFHLTGVRATFTQIGGAHGRAQRVDVQTSGLRPHKVTIHGAELALHGPSERVLGDFARWRANLGNAPSAHWSSARWFLQGAHVVWRAPMGDGVRVEALDVNAEVRPTELHVRSDHVTVAVAQSVFGPWRVDADRFPTSARLRVALDPGVPEACTVLVVEDGERITSVDVAVPQSPLEHLGLPGSLIGLDTSRTQLEADIHYAALGPTRADVRATGNLHEVVLPMVPRPIDLAWEGTLSGDANEGIDVRKARLAVGPLVGPLSGTLKRFDDGFRIDLAWAAGPVPCEAFGAPLGFGQPFEIGYVLRRLAETSKGTLHHGSPMAGTVSASVMISFDSRDPSTTKIDFVPQVGCRG